ncbi:hypothetical protein EHM76_02565 [bacterium]|nr:MAG: hypothetical protein EHM76_02565 [bacterium]
MKTLFFLTLAVLLCSFSPDVKVGIEGDATVVGIILATAYEILARVIPTVKDYTIVGRFIKWLHKASEWLNARKPVNQYRP